MTYSESKKNAALDRLNTEVKGLLDSETWKAALALRSKLHKYSFNNLLLVWSQRPGSTMLAGFNRWKDLGRHVKKGEKGIAILAPIIVNVKDEETGEKTGTKLVGFKTVYVFDVEQTDGKDLPQEPRPTILTGSSESAAEALELLVKAVEANGNPLSFVGKDELGSALGSYDPLGKGIRVRSDVPTLQQAKTLAHELAHAVLGHDVGDDYQLGELEAETTAYLVMDAMGLDTGGYSFAYLANWAGDAEDFQKVLTAGTRGIEAANQILASITAKASAEPEALAA